METSRMRLVFFFLFLFIHLAAVGLRYITGRGGGCSSVVVHRLSSYAVQAYLLLGQWDLSFLTKDRTHAPTL